MGVGTALLIAGGVMGGVSGIAAGINAEQNAEFNATMSEYEGKYARQKAKLDEDLLRDDEARTIGSARAIAGSTGFVTDSGSNLDAAEDIMRSFAIDASIIRSGGKMEEWSAKSQAGLYQSQGKQTKRAGYVNAFSDMLMTGSRVAGGFKKPKTSGLLSSKYRWGRYA